MVQILAPINTLLNTGTTNPWSTTGAATPHECTDEGMAASDGATTRMNAAGTDTNVIWIGNFTSALAPGTTGGVTMSIMLAERTPGMTNSALLVQMGSTADGIIASRNLSFSGTSYTQYTYTLDYATEEIYLTDWPNLAMRVVMVATPAAQVRVTTLEITVPDPPVGLRGWYHPMWRFT